MRKARIYNFGLYAGDFFEIEKEKKYKFIYNDGYKNSPISLTMPVSQKEFDFDTFPPFFEGLLPEGIQLEALLRETKTDKNDLFSQLVLVGKDMVGSVTAEEAK